MDSPDTCPSPAVEVVKTVVVQGARPIVRLNVGGSRYTVGLSTLTCAEGSYFDILLSGRWGSQLTEEGEVFIDRDGEIFKHVLHYLRARASSSEAMYLPADEATRQALIAEARYYMLPGLEALLDSPSGDTGSFCTVYKQQSTALDEYIEAQPFAAIKQLLFDILLGQRGLKSAWNPSLDQGTIMVSLMNAPLVRVSFSVMISSDHVALTENVNRFKVVLPDQLLESVFSGYYEIYLYEFARTEIADVNRCIYNLGTRAVLLRMLQEQSLFDVRMAYDKRAKSSGGFEFELVLEFHRRAGPVSPRYSTP